MLMHVIVFAGINLGLPAVFTPRLLMSFGEFSPCAWWLCYGGGEYTLLDCA